MWLIYLQKTDWTLVLDITQTLKEKICFLKIRAQVFLGKGPFGVSDAIDETSVRGWKLDFGPA